MPHIRAPTVRAFRSPPIRQRGLSVDHGEFQLDHRPDAQALPSCIYLLFDAVKDNRITFNLDGPDLPSFKYKLG